MVNVQAPSGYEANRCFNVDCKRWQAYARPTSSQWWTHVGDVGPDGAIDAELDARAAELAASWIRLGLVR